MLQKEPTPAADRAHPCTPAVGVNWENVERLPLREKRRMEELEYLLMG
jgi:hypothetical protein